MKNLFSLSLIILSTIFISCSSSDYGDIDVSSVKSLNNFSEGFAAIQVGNLWGYINTSGDLVIKPQFHEASEFSQGYAAVKLNEKWGFINSKGVIVINPQYDEAKGFYGKLAPIKSGDSWGYINTKGELVIEYQFDDANSFTGDYATTKMGNKWGFINTGGQYEINPMCEGAGSFSQGLAPVIAEHFGNKWGYINKNGEYDINPQYDNARQFSDDIKLAAVYIDGQWGYIDNNGKFVINPDYEDALVFSEGLAAVKLNGKWGYIDKKNRKVLDFVYDQASCFNGGFALVTLKGKCFYMDKQGEDANIMTITAQSGNTDVGRWKPPGKRLDASVSCLVPGSYSCNEFLNFYNFSEDTVTLFTSGTGKNVTAMYNNVIIPPMQMFRAKDIIDDYNGFIYMNISNKTYGRVWLFSYRSGIYAKNNSMSLVADQPTIDSLKFHKGYFNNYSDADAYSLCYKFDKYNIYLQRVCDPPKDGAFTLAATVIIESNSEPLVNPY